MAQESLSILTTDEGKEMLAETFKGVIENVQKETISTAYKNTELSGNPDSGSFTAKRFANANSKEYGSARTAGKGESVKALTVTVNIDTDCEFVEELENKDIQLYTVRDVVGRRANNHALGMVNELDTAFFACAAEAATEVKPKGTTTAEQLEEFIQALENTKNKFVNGVPRRIMGLVLNTEMYGKVRNDLDKQSRTNVDTTTEEFYAWHGVEVKSCINLPDDVIALVMVKGAVAQPVMASTYTAEKIPLSEAYAVELFYHYGTKAVAPDLIYVIKKKPTTAGDNQESGGN